MFFEQSIKAFIDFPGVFIKLSGLHYLRLVPFILVVELIPVVEISGIEVPGDRPGIFFLIPDPVIELLKSVASYGLFACCLK